MKKLKAMVAVMMAMVGVFANTSVAWASEAGVTVRAGEVTVREMTVREMEALLSEANMQLGNMDEVSGPSQVLPAASYTPYEYSRTYEFYEGNRAIGDAEIVCVVWRYTDGKVHLYRRTITTGARPTYDASRTYGSMVNTDGSLSYTTGDRVQMHSVLQTWTYAIDFRVTPSEYSFSCYEV